MTLRAALRATMALVAAAALGVMPVLADPVTTGFLARINRTTGLVEVNDGTLVNGGWVPMGTLSPTAHAFVPQGLGAVQAGIAAEVSRAQSAEGLLAPLASPALTGAPTAPTAVPGTSTTQIGTTAFATAAVAAEAAIARLAEQANATAVVTERTRALAAEALAFPASSAGTAAGKNVGTTTGTVADGSVDPIARGALQSGKTVQPVTGGTVTLNAVPQTDMLVLTGALTSNLTLQWPSGSPWHGAVVNQTTGAYTVTLQVPGQSLPAVALPSSFVRHVTSDGMNLQSPASEAALLTSPTSTTPGDGACWASLTGQALADCGGPVPLTNAANIWTGLQTFLNDFHTSSGGTNGVTLSGGASGSPATVSATGGDANIGLVLATRGTGALTFGPVPDGTVTGGLPRGTNAVDLQIARYGSGQVASGQTSTIAGGSSNTSSGNTSTVIGGYNNVASNTGSVASGFSNLANGGYDQAGGFQSSTRGRLGANCYASGQFIAKGDAQSCSLTLRGTGASASAIRLTADGAVAGTANTVNIPAQSAYAFDLRLIVLDYTTPANTYMAEWQGHALTRSGAQSTTLLDGGTAAVASDRSRATNSWAPTVSVTPDTTIGGLNVTFTPPAGNTDTIHVVACLGGGLCEVQ